MIVLRVDQTTRQDDPAKTAQIEALSNFTAPAPPPAPAPPAPPAFKDFKPNTGKKGDKAEKGTGGVTKTIGKKGKASTGPPLCTEATAAMAKVEAIKKNTDMDK